LLFDTEGRLWVGHRGGGGLIVLKPQSATSITAGGEPDKLKRIQCGSASHLPDQRVQQTQRCVNCLVQLPLLNRIHRLRVECDLARAKTTTLDTLLSTYANQIANLHFCLSLTVFQSEQQALRSSLDFATFSFLDTRLVRPPGFQRKLVSTFPRVIEPQGAQSDQIGDLVSLKLLC